MIIGPGHWYARLKATHRTAIKRYRFYRRRPLALLPLPDAHQRALIWSLPHERATALGAIEAALFIYELAKATDGQAGALRPITPRAVQPLSLALRNIYR